MAAMVGGNQQELEALGRRICEARERAGLSQQRLADATRLSVRQIIRLEQGQARPLRSTMARIADVTEDGTLCFETIKAFREPRVA